MNKGVFFFTMTIIFTFNFLFGKQTVIQARVIKFLPSYESIMYTRVNIEFSNTSSKKCQLKGYTLFWGKSRKKVRLEKVYLEAGEKIDRWIRVYDRLSSQSKISIEVDSDCP